MNLKQKLSLYGQVIFYFIAGVNHFWHPEFYIKLIPDYIPFHASLNWMSGLFELLFCLGLIFDSTRKYSSIGIILMLLAFIPAHIFVIQLGGCIDNSLCVPNWIAWLRLIIIHPMLMWWAWNVRLLKKV